MSSVSFKLALTGVCAGGAADRSVLAISLSAVPVLLQWISPTVWGTKTRQINACGDTLVLRPFPPTL